MKQTGLNYFIIIYLFINETNGIKLFHYYILVSEIKQTGLNYFIIIYLSQK